MDETANMLVLSEGPSLVVQRHKGGWDQCQSIGQEKGCEKDCEDVEGMVLKWVLKWVFQLPMRVVRWPAGEFDMWVAVTMFPHGLATAPVIPELVCSSFQDGTHDESKIEALSMECPPQVC